MKLADYKRSCQCDHGYPLCACYQGLTGAALLKRSNRLSAIAGWPSPELDDEVVAGHERAIVEMAERRKQDAIRATQPVVTVHADARPAKPRVALGVDQHKLPPPGCTTCDDKSVTAPLAGQAEP